MTMCFFSYSSDNTVSSAISMPIGSLSYIPGKMVSQVISVTMGFWSCNTNNCFVGCFSGGGA